MKTTTALALAATLTLAICVTSTAQAAPVAFDWATVGNPGNAGDVQSQAKCDAARSVGFTRAVNAEETVKLSLWPKAFFPP